MNRLILVSNRLPVKVVKTPEGFVYQTSIGGLATGLSGVRTKDSPWVGWVGLPSEELTEKDRQRIAAELKAKFNCVPVFLTAAEITGYYDHFANKTIWPLFHYFTNKTEYSDESWATYKAVNRKFFDAVAPLVKPGDLVWIHDYQLMLLPELIKGAFPDNRVGFFLHIPFPSYELFRLMIWRNEILEGILGADLIGFHTFDYLRHFTSAVLRILGLDTVFNRIEYEGRVVRVGTFPMGVDFPYFAKDFTAKRFHDLDAQIKATKKDQQYILSVDRLDYTKGIPERIKAFGRFLADNPDYRGKVRLNLIVAPSRTDVDSYEELKKVITEEVSEVNGKYGSMDWMPIWYMFQSFSQEELIAYYRNSEVLLVTPLRDGMNLVAKEYEAANNANTGMVVISETAGAADEFGEGIIVNPNDEKGIAEGLLEALTMAPAEKTRVNEVIRSRLSRYDVRAWALDFTKRLARREKERPSATPLLAAKAGIAKAYAKAHSRLFLLDYDGTLVRLRKNPRMAVPDSELVGLLGSLATVPGNDLAIVTGRGHDEIEEWLGRIPGLTLVAEHGLFVKKPGGRWELTMEVASDWKKGIYEVLELYSDRMPGSVIEDKDYSLAFHYRQVDPAIVKHSLGELKMTLLHLTAAVDLTLQEGKKVLEVKDSRFSKGTAAGILLRARKHDFVLAAGDDVTDEDMFGALPDTAYAIKVGTGKTLAGIEAPSWKEIRALLKDLEADAAEA